MSHLRAHECHTRPRLASFAFAPGLNLSTPHPVLFILSHQHGSISLLLTEVEAFTVETLSAIKSRC